MIRKLNHYILWLVSLLAYFLILTPVGIFLRLIRKDPLERVIDPGRKSYWSDRSA